MAHGDVTLLVTYIVGVVGDIMSAIGDVFTADALDAGVMADLTTGIFGENGGLIYWLNEKLLWLMEQILAGLSFTVAG
jgi:hypothetical protein